jgi:glycosyltransferase involved in cell wall biosynthesis
MRVLLVNDWTTTGGGIERYMVDVAAGLRAAGDEVRILTADVGDAREFADELALTSDRPAAQAFLQIVNPSAVRKARALVRSFRPHVALVAMFEMRLSPGVLTALRGVPTVLSVAYYKPICPIGLKLLPDGRVCTVPAGRVCVTEGCVGWAHWLRDRPRYALIGRGLRHAAAIITCSEHMARRLREAGLDPLYHPWPSGRPDPQFAREPADQPLFVYAGRLGPEKGVVQLVDAFAAVAAQVGGARLEILGDGPLRAQVEAAIEAHGLGSRLEMRGWVDRAELDESLRRAWAVVVPSLWEEPLGLIAIEAIVRGVPVVASASGGLVEVIEPGRTGSLVPVGDREALRAALQDIATGAAFPGQRVDGDAAADLARRHDLDTHCAWLRSLFARIAA